MVFPPPPPPPPPSLWFMVGFGFPPPPPPPVVHDLWFMGLGFKGGRDKAAKVSGLPFSLPSFIGEFKFSGVGFMVWGLG